MFKLIIFLCLTALISVDASIKDDLKAELLKTMKPGEKIKERVANIVHETFVQMDESHDQTQTTEEIVEDAEPIQTDEQQSTDDSEEENDENLFEINLDNDQIEDLPEESDDDIPDENEDMSRYKTDL